MTVCKLPVVERSLYQSAVPLTNNQGKILCLLILSTDNLLFCSGGQHGATQLRSNCNRLRDQFEDAEIPDNRKHVSFQMLKRGTPLVVLQMAVGLHQQLQRMSTDTFFSEVVAQIS